MDPRVGPDAVGRRNSPAPGLTRRTDPGGLGRGDSGERWVFQGAVLRVCVSFLDCVDRGKILYISYSYRDPIKMFLPSIMVSTGCLDMSKRFFS